MKFVDRLHLMWKRDLVDLVRGVASSTTREDWDARAEAAAEFLAGSRIDDLLDLPYDPSTTPNEMLGDRSRMFDWVHLWNGAKSSIFYFKREQGIEALARQAFEDSSSVAIRYLGMLAREGCECDQIRKRIEEEFTALEMLERCAAIEALTWISESEAEVHPILFEELDRKIKEGDPMDALFVIECIAKIDPTVVSSHEKYIRSILSGEVKESANSMLEDALYSLGSDETQEDATHPPPPSVNQIRAAAALHRFLPESHDAREQLECWLEEHESEEIRSWIQEILASNEVPSN